ncbi:MAG: hypothetical protein NXI31_05725 [bacterium]|nr:hypothetical protein [bacterium]
MRSLVAVLCSTAALLAQQPPGPPQGGAPGQRRQQPTPMLVPQIVAMPRGDRGVVIDGALTDWPELPAIRLDDRRQLSGTAFKAWNGPRDASAITFVMWDEEHLYFAAAVRDEWHRPLDAGSLQLSEIPLADSIVLTFDPDRNTRSLGPDKGRREDREFWLAEEAGREVVQWDRLRGTARVLDAPAARSVVLHDKEQGLTTYEARIPWSEILPTGRKPRARLVLDLQIVVNDFDEPTDTVPQTRIGLTFGCSPVVDPGFFASVMLVSDRQALQGRVPAFPPKPPTEGPPLGPAEQWHDLTARLLAQGPAIHDGTKAPEQAGGLKRFGVLEELDAHVGRYPRVDFLEYTHRIQRRMAREVAGIRARGLPFWWETRLRALSKAAEDPVPEGTARLFRLPMGGWLVATPQGGFAIDAAGPDLANWIWGRTAFCLLTQPLDITRRNDQLLVRMLTGKVKRPVLSHVAFHLPVIKMRDMPLVQPGKEVATIDDMRIIALGEKIAEDSVIASCGYRIEIKNGPRMLVVAPGTRPTEIGDEPVDVLILSPRNPQVPAIIAQAKPGLVVLDDAFLCESLPGFARANLNTMHKIQKALQPVPSLLLAPGESWDIQRRQ